MTDFIVVIPARYESSRLPGKPLVDIGGRPMIAWVHEQASKSEASEIIVATDDERVAETCRQFGARVEMTSPTHPSGTDRIAELARRFNWEDRQIIVNVQGDEPLLPQSLINQVAALLAHKPDAAVATLVTPVRSDTDFNDANMVKVVVDDHGYALYFSRAPIPHTKDGHTTAAVRRHVGMYAYRTASLKAIAAAPPCAIETQERLEQLRALYLGHRIAIADAVEAPARGVDTEADLAEIRQLVLGRLE